MDDLKLDLHYDKVLKIASRGKMERIKNLLSIHPEILNRPSEGHNRTILWESVNKNRNLLAEFLIQKGADVNIPGRYRSETFVLLKPYCIAIRNKNERLQNVIISNGHQMDIFSLAYLGKINEIQQSIRNNKELLNQTQSVDTLWKVTPLHYAVFSKNIETVHGLLKLGSEVKTHSKLLYDIACRTNQIKIIELLSKYGGTPKEADVFSVFYNSNEEVINYFVDNGLDCDKLTDLGWPAIVYLCRGDKGENPEKVTKLLKHIKNINAQTPKGVSALHASAKAGFSIVTQLLIDNGADVNIRDIKGKTPLSYSIKFKRTETEKILLEHGGIV